MSQITNSISKQESCYNFFVYRDYWFINFRSIDSSYIKTICSMQGDRAVETVVESITRILMHTNNAQFLQSALRMLQVCAYELFTSMKIIWKLKSNYL